MTSRLGWSLAAAGAALAAVPAVVLLRGHGAPVPATGVAAAVAALTPVPATATPAPRVHLLEANVVFTQGRAVPRNPPLVHAAAAILVDPDTGRILWQQSARTRLAPASTVKLLTALVVLENFAPDRPITVTPDALQLAWASSEEHTSELHSRV